MPATRVLTPAQRERKRQRERERRARLRTDPAWRQRERERKRQHDRERRARLRTDPAWLEKERERHRRKRRAIKADPERNARRIEKERERSRRVWRAIKADPERHARRRANEAVASVVRRSPLGQRAIVERFDPHEIYERDGWRCQLCGEGFALEPHTPGEPTLDHIVPVEAGGVHSRANTRLAHRGCNTRRSNVRRSRRNG